MKDKMGKIIAFSVLAILAVVYVGYELFAACGVTPKFLGIILGLGGGFASIMLDEANRVFNWRVLAVRLFSICLSPLGVILILPFSAQLGGGYFIGAAVVSCAGIAIQSLGEIAERKGDLPRI
jgi:hypothetical protein